MLESKTQGPVATHRDAGNASSRGSTFRPILLLHLRHKFLGEEVFIAQFAICRIEIKSMSAARSQDYKIADLPARAQMLHYVPTAKVKERLLVIAQPVQVIQHGIVSCLILI